MSQLGPCCVVDQHCVDPANSSEHQRLGTCVSCEDAVCPNCSVLVRSKALFTSGRWCANCMSNRADDFPVLREALTRYVQRWYKLSGYVVSTDKARKTRDQWYGFRSVPKPCPTCKGSGVAS